MVLFIDKHEMGSITPEKLHELVNEPKDEFGVLHKDLLYNKDENTVMCILDAPSKEAVMKHHEKYGIKPDWTYEVKSAKD